MKKLSISLAQLFSCYFLGFLLLSACEDRQEDFPAPQLPSAIVHTRLTPALPIAYGGMQPLDLNGDSFVDFSFGVMLVAGPEGVRREFLATSLRDGRIFLLEEGAVAFPKNTLIGPDLPANIGAWRVDSGHLVSRVEPAGQPVFWRGPWENLVDGYLAVSFRLEGRPHYGWIRVASDIHQNRLTVEEFAYQSLPYQPIRTGQTE